MNSEQQSRSRTRRKRKARRSRRKYSSSQHFDSDESHRAPTPGSSRDLDHAQSDNRNKSQADVSGQKGHNSRQRQSASSSQTKDVSNSQQSANACAQRGNRREGQAGESGQKRHNGRQRQPASSSRTCDVSSSQPSTNAHQSSDSHGSDIPGYYYDKEAKLYFKIQSYSLGSVTPFITKDKIVSQQKEKQRVLDIKNLTSKKLPATTVSCRPGVGAQRQNNHLVNMLGSVQCGQFTCENMRTYIVRHMCSRLQPDVRWDNSLPGQPSLCLGEIQNMEVSKKRDKIACVSSLKSSYSHIIQLMTVNEQQQSHPSEIKRAVLQVKVPFLALGPIHKRIKTICWAPLTSRSQQATVLYTTVCPIGCLASIAYISNLEAETDHERILFEVNLGKTIIWSSAWSTHGHRFTIGAERKCYLIDVATRKQWTFSTFDSDALSQLFSPSSPYIYNGTRKGHIVLHDMRAREAGCNTLMMKQAPGVGCLRLLKDENYLMASDFSGTICTWDQRMRKKVMEYQGLMNSHWQLPFHLDETESLLTSTGSDSYTKVWDIKSGEILRSIPPPYPVSCDNFPLSFYSTRWGNRNGNNALMVAMRNSFRFYTYK